MSAPTSKNIFWLSVSRIVALVLLFVAYAQLFRYLGPFSSGQYQSVLSYVTIFGVIVDFGIQQYIIKKISEQPDQAKKYFHNFLVTEVILASLVYAILLLIAYFGGYRGQMLGAIAVAGSGMLVNGLTYPFLAVMSAFYDLRKVAFINFLNSLINVAVIFTAIAWHKHIVFLASNQVIFGLVGLIIYTRYVRKHIPSPEIFRALRRFDIKLVRATFLAAFPFALLAGFATIYNRIDVLLISKILGYSQAGIYTAAYKFFDLMGFFPAVISFSLYPLLTAYMARRELGQIRSTIEKYLRFLLALALPMAVGGMLLAKPLIILLAGPQFAEAAPVLAILVWAPAILFVYIVANSLVISQLTKFAVIITGVNVLVNVFGNLILLRHFGIKAAAIMTLISESLQGIFYFYFIRKKITAFAFWRYVWRPFLASAIMGAALWSSRSVINQVTGQQFAAGSTAGLGSYLILSVIEGAIVYIAVLALTKFFHSDDWQFVRNFFRSPATNKVVPTEPIV